MMRLLAVAAAVLICGGMVVPAAAEDTPTYNGSVGRILLDNCASCHRPDQVAPMSLLSFGEARPWARAIRAKVESREMPPWFADPRFGKFSNDTSLSDEEIAAVVAWVDAGAPEGGGAAPEAPQFSDAGWSHPSGLPPDFIYEFPIEWHIEPEGETPNFNVYTRLPFDEPMWVTATEVHPGNRAVTHHITTGITNIPPGMKVGAGPVWAGGPVADYVLVPDPGGREDSGPDPVEKFSNQVTRGKVSDGFSTGFGTYVPGKSLTERREGYVQAIRGDLFTHIRWNLHYQATGKPETARPRVGAWTAAEPDNVKFAPAAVAAEGIHGRGADAGGAGAARRPRRGARAGREHSDQPEPEPAAGPDPAPRGELDRNRIGGFRNDSLLQDIWIHAHARGKDFTCVLTYPDGREEIVLRVENYSFDWQYRYYFEEPPLVPAGSTLKVIGRYDNSRANRSNPAPHKPGYWSEQSWDDMFVVSAGYTLAGDENAGDN